MVAGSKAVGGAAKELGGAAGAAAGAAGAATRDGLASGAYKMQQLGDSTEAGLKQVRQG